jgi:hypothetical protein
MEVASQELSDRNIACVLDLDADTPKQHYLRFETGNGLWLPRVILVMRFGNLCITDAVLLRVIMLTTLHS